MHNKLQKDEDEWFQIEIFNDDRRLPQSGLLWVKVYLRFSNSTKYQVSISYLSIDDDVIDSVMKNGEYSLTIWSSNGKNL